MLFLHNKNTVNFLRKSACQINRHPALSSTIFSNSGTSTMFNNQKHGFFNSKFPISIKPIPSSRNIQDRYFELTYQQNELDENQQAIKLKDIADWLDKSGVEVRYVTPQDNSSLPYPAVLVKDSATSFSNLMQAMIEYQFLGSNAQNNAEPTSPTINK